MYMEKNEIVIDPILIHNGLFHILIKEKIINDIAGEIDFKGTILPICTLNMNVLRKYDFAGVNIFMKRKGKYAK